MASSYSEHRTIKLDNVRQNNIVLVDLSEKLSESVFEQEYKKAAKIIQNIIAQSNSKRSQKESFYNPHGNSQQHKLNLTEFQTAVPFIGDRGTGKTSIMCSVLERLKYYKGGKSSAAFYLDSHNDNTHFIAFDMIDANTLKGTEDVMEIILSRMLNYLEEIPESNDFRDLYRQIDELYKDLNLVYWKKPDTRNEPNLIELQRIADSQKAIAGFQKLVLEFTSAISKHKFDNNPCYLVLALDDIDMYQGSDSGMQNRQFALLEHIYNYMRVPGLIVLMTYNEHILKRKCNSHFKEIYFGSKKLEGPTPAEQRDIEALTGQFMSKLFPQEQRIYLPNYMFINSADRSNLYVKPTLNNARGNPEVIAPFTNDQELPVKDFMLRLIAHKTGVYFDAAGTKKHFFEPRNLRELGELFQFIYSMDEIPKESANQEYVRSKNRQELLNYLYNQFALKHLNSEEYKQFHALSMLPLVRQGRALVDCIRQQRLVVADSEDSFGYLAKTSHDRWRYSYGELLHNLYFATRIPKGHNTDETFFSKEYMHCILGTHSVILNQTLQMPDSHNAMLAVIGSSIAGRWANEMLPHFFVEGLERPIATGSISLPVRDFFNWKIPSNVQQAILNLCSDNDPQSEMALRQFMEALVIAGMFFSGFPTNGLKISLDADLDDDKKAAIYLRSTSEDHICFNVFNFATNLFDALPIFDKENKGYFSNIEEKLKKLGKNCAELCAIDWEVRLDEAKRMRKKAEEQVETTQKSQYLDALNAAYRRIDESEAVIKRAEAWRMLLTECPSFNENVFLQKWNETLQETISGYQSSIEQWQKKHKKFPIALPVQNFDMIYNIMKRLASVSYHDIPEEAPIDEVYGYYVILYKSVAEELRNQDKVYFNKNQGFEKAFCDSLFYKVVTAEKESTDYNPYIREVFVSMVQTTSRAQVYRKKTNLF